MVNVMEVKKKLVWIGFLPVLLTFGKIERDSNSPSCLKLFLISLTRAVNCSLCSSAFSSTMDSPTTLCFMLMKNCSAKSYYLNNWGEDNFDRLTETAVDFLWFSFWEFECQIKTIKSVEFHEFFGRVDESKTMIYRFQLEKKFVLNVEL